MTKQDYQLIANAIASLPSPSVRQDAAEALAKALATTNARFDRGKFIAACTVPASERGKR